MRLRSWLAVASITFASVDVVVAATAFDQSHAAFSHLLGQRVRDGLVDYATLKSEPGPLAVYLDRLAQIAESEFDAWPEKERLAYLINLYNAATLKLIVDHYPVKSIRSIGWLPGRAWKQDVVKVFGRTLSLDEVEHGIIRRDYQDPRVFAPRAVVRRYARRRLSLPASMNNSMNRVVSFFARRTRIASMSRGMSYTFRRSSSGSPRTSWGGQARC
jgi:hypothetical protein